MVGQMMDLCFLDCTSSETLIRPICCAYGMLLYVFPCAHNGYSIIGLWAQRQWMLSANVLRCCELNASAHTSRRLKGYLFCCKIRKLSERELF